PWIRLLARYFDYALFFLLLLFTRKAFHGQLPLGKYEYFIPFEFFAWVLIEAILLCTWGTTPGKWFLKTKLKAGKRYKLNFFIAIRRSFSVWVRGIGLGIVGLNFFCMLVAFHRLKTLRITSWDRDDHIQVIHSPIGRWRIYVAVFLAACGILYYYQAKGRELQDVRTVVRSVDEYSSSAHLRTRLYLSS
ncbi:MAG: peptidase S41, partial [uncultured bacterium]